MVFASTLPNISFASVSSGTIQNKYAWSENGGWVNFGTTEGNVRITDTAITGYVWDQNYGWINLSPSQSGIVNDGEGNLSGFAWSENGGWIDFSSVEINTIGKFTGMASGSSYGRLTFDCVNCSVTTDWRPSSVRSEDISLSENRRSSGSRRLVSSFINFFTTDTNDLQIDTSSSTKIKKDDDIVEDLDVTKSQGEDVYQEKKDSLVESGVKEETVSRFQYIKYIIGFFLFTLIIFIFIWKKTRKGV